MIGDGRRNSSANWHNGVTASEGGVFGVRRCDFRTQLHTMRNGPQLATKFMS